MLSTKNPQKNKKVLSDQFVHLRSLSMSNIDTLISSKKCGFEVCYQQCWVDFSWITNVLDFFDNLFASDHLIIFSKWLVATINFKASLDVFYEGWCVWRRISPSIWVQAFLISSFIFFRIIEWNWNTVASNVTIKKKSTHVKSSDWPSVLSQHGQSNVDDNNGTKFDVQQQRNVLDTRHATTTYYTFF